MDKSNLKLLEKMILEFVEINEQYVDERLKIVLRMKSEHRAELLEYITKLIINSELDEKNILHLTPRDIKANLDKAQDIIYKNAKANIKEEQQVLEDTLKEIVKETYIQQGYVLSLGINFKLNMLEDAEIDKIVKAMYKDSTFSKRIWKNQNDLLNDLNKSISDFLKGNKSANQIVKEIKNKYSASAYDSNRLFRTESSRCEEECRQEFAHQHKIKKKMYCATLDKRTSSKCREYDQTTYKIDSVSAPNIPQHPCCRCCWILLPNGDWKPFTRRDNEAKEIIDYTDYENWKNEI